MATGTTTVTSGRLITALGWAADNEDGSPGCEGCGTPGWSANRDAALGGSRLDVAATYNNPAWGKSGLEFNRLDFWSRDRNSYGYGSGLDSSGNQTIPELLHYLRCGK